MYRFRQHDSFSKVRVCNARIAPLRTVGVRSYRSVVSPGTIWTHFDITMTPRTTLRTTFGRKTEFLSWTLIPRFECPVFGFFRIVTTRVVRGRWYRSKMFLGMLLYYSGGGSTPVVIMECSNSPWSKCWRNRWIPLRTESDLRSDNDMQIELRGEAAFSPCNYEE